MTPQPQSGINLHWSLSVDWSQSQNDARARNSRHLDLVWIHYKYYIEKTAHHVKRIDPVEKVVQQIPTEQAFRDFGRATKLLLDPKNIPDIGYMLPTIDEEEDVDETEMVIEQPERSHSSGTDDPDDHGNIINIEDVNCLAGVSIEQSECSDGSETEIGGNLKLLGEEGAKCGMWSKLCNFMSEATVTTDQYKGIDLRL